MLVFTFFLAAVTVQAASIHECECSSSKECGVRGIILAQEGREEAALSCWRLAKQMDSSNPLPYLALGARAKEAGRTEESRELLQHAMMLKPSENLAAYNLGNLEASEGHLEVAMRIFKLLTRTRPHWPQGHYALGFLHLVLGEIALACKHFRSTWRLRPDFSTLPGYREAYLAASTRCSIPHAPILDAKSHEALESNDNFDHIRQAVGSIHRVAETAEMMKIVLCVDNLCQMSIRQASIWDGVTVMECGTKDLRGTMTNYVKNSSNSVDCILGFSPMMRAVNMENIRKRIERIACDPTIESNLRIRGGDDFDGTVICNQNAARALKCELTSDSLLPGVISQDDARGVFVVSISSSNSFFRTLYSSIAKSRLHPSALDICDISAEFDAKSTHIFVLSFESIDRIEWNCLLNARKRLLKLDAVVLAVFSSGDSKSSPSFHRLHEILQFLRPEYFFGETSLPQLTDTIGALIWPQGNITMAPMPECNLRIKPQVHRPFPIQVIGKADNWGVEIKSRICIGVPTLSPPSSASLPFFDTFMTTLVKSINCSQSADNSISVTVYVGHDEGDPGYDGVTGDETWRKIANLVDQCPHRFALKRFRFPLTKGGIAFLWNSLMKAAVADGCDYLYQSNDDIEFISPNWAPRFIETLQSNPLHPNFGVVGALDENNRMILTQSLVHRTHHAIFETHFPVSMRNWHLDDYMSNLYPPSSTFHLKDLRIRNTNKFGTRYHECHEDKILYEREAAAGRKKIEAWLRGKQAAVN